MKITALIPNPENATSMYRGMSVLNELHKLDNSVDVSYPERTYIPAADNTPALRKMGFSYMTAKGSDMLFALRPIVGVHMQFFEYARRYNTPIITDYDDNLFEIPKSNQAYAECENKGNLEVALRNSNHVIVSTETLYKCFNRFNPNITVVKNSFDNYSYKLVEKRNNNAVKTVLWRGSCTHIKDLSIYKAALITLVRENPTINFCFWSDELPAWLYAFEQEVDNITIKQQVHPFEYHMHLKALKPDLVIVPLQDNIFNRCKSDIAKLEAVSVGALALTPDWHEWQWPCTPPEFMFNGIEDFYNKCTLLINRLTDNDVNLDAIYDKHLEHIKANRLLSEANKLRLEVFKAVQSQQS